MNKILTILGVLICGNIFAATESVMTDNTGKLVANTNFLYVNITNTDGSITITKINTNGSIDIRASASASVGGGTNFIFAVQGDSLSVTNNFADFNTNWNGTWQGHMYLNYPKWRSMFNTNWAISGQLLSSMSANYGTTIKGVEPGATNKFNGGILFLWGGFNDIRGGDTAVNAISYASNILFKARQGGLRTVIFTIHQSSVISGAALTERLTYNNFWRNGANKYLFDYLADPETWFTNASANAMLAQYDGGDGVHFNQFANWISATNLDNLVRDNSVPPLGIFGGTMIGEYLLIPKLDGANTSVGKTSLRFRSDGDGYEMYLGPDSIITSDSIWAYSNVGLNGHFRWGYGIGTGSTFPANFQVFGTFLATAGVYLGDNGPVAASPDNISVVFSNVNSTTYAPVKAANYSMRSTNVASMLSGRYTNDLNGMLDGLVRITANNGSASLQRTVLLFSAVTYPGRVEVIRDDSKNASGSNIWIQTVSSQKINSGPTVTNIALDGGSITLASDGTGFAIVGSSSSGNTPAISNLVDVSLAVPVTGDFLQYDSVGVWRNFHPFFQINYNLTVVSNVTINVGTNLEQSLAVPTATSFGIVYNGTPLPGERYHLAVSNANSSAISMTNNSYDTRIQANVPTYTIPGSSIMSFTFVNRTNWNPAGTNRWELDAVMPYIQTNLVTEAVGSMTLTGILYTADGKKLIENSSSSFYFGGAPAISGTLGASLSVNPAGTWSIANYDGTSFYPATIGAPQPADIGSTNTFGVNYAWRTVISTNFTMHKGLGDVPQPGRVVVAQDANGRLSFSNTIAIATNTASFSTVAPASLHSITIDKGWTNDLGARADMVIAVKMSDATTGDPALGFTNSITGEAWTNTITGGLVQTHQFTIVIPDLSPNDRGYFTNISSGSGSTLTFLNAWWKLK